MRWFLEWMLIIGLSFIGLGLLGGSSLAVQRRRHFWIRVLLQCLGMVVAVLLLFGAMELKLVSQHVLMLFWLVLVMSALIVAPLCCYRSAGSSPGSDGGGGGGGGTDPPPPSGPRGGVPLLDAEQAIARVRDHTRPKLHHPGPRRPGREPERAPARTHALARP